MALCIPAREADLSLGLALRYLLEGLSGLNEAARQRPGATVRGALREHTLPPLPEDHARADEDERSRSDELAKLLHVTGHSPRLCWRWECKGSGGRVPGLTHVTLGDLEQLSQ